SGVRDHLDLRAHRRPAELDADRRPVWGRSPARTHGGRWCRGWALGRSLALAASHRRAAEPEDERRAPASDQREAGGAVRHAWHPGYASAVKPDCSAIDRRIDELLPELEQLARRIHEHPELRFEEHRAAAWVAEFVEKWGGVA